MSLHKSRLARTRGVFLVCVLALLIAACGGGSGDADVTTTSPTTAATTVADDDDDDDGASDGDGAGPGGHASFEDLVAAAQAEGGPVLVRNPAQAVVLEALADGFEALYGIPAEIDGGHTGPIIEQMTAERSAGVYETDVVGLQDVRYFEQLHSEGALHSLDRLPSMEHWPQEALVVEGTTAMWSIVPYSIVWNTDLVQGDDVPTSWEDLADLPPEIPLAIIDLNSEVFVARYTRLHDMFGQEWFDRFADRVDYRFTASPPAVEATVAGEYGVAAGPGWSPIYQVLSQGTAPIDAIETSHEFGAGERLTAALNDGPNPNAALLFVHYMLTEEAQEIANGLPYNDISPLPGVPGSQELPPNFWPVDITLSETPEADYVRDALN